MIARPRRRYVPHPRPNILPPVALACAVCGKPASWIARQILGLPTFTCLCDGCGRACEALSDD